MSIQELAVAIASIAEPLAMLTVGLPPEYVMRYFGPLQVERMMTATT